jgi:uncharacterized YigZ family protein
MEKQGSYLTIASRSGGLYKEKGSKFLSFAFPVSSREEAEEIISSLKKEYQDARHLCYAYLTGSNRDILRTSDGGEPRNSAGRHILGQIYSKQLTDILVVVVRYFGGTLLGIGGLAHAYQKAAEDALCKATIIIKQRYAIFEVQFPYTGINDVMKIIKAESLTVKKQLIDSVCSMELAVPEDRELPVTRNLGILHDIHITRIQH